MNIKIEELVNYLISRTDEEKDERVFWTKLTLYWEDPKVKVGENDEWKSHFFEVKWDQDKLGWVNHKFDWSRNVEPRFIWVEYDVEQISTDLFHGMSSSEMSEKCHPSEFSEYLEVGKRLKTDILQMALNVEGIKKFSLTGIKLKPDPEKCRNEVIQILHDAENKRRCFIDVTPVDENGHIHIDHWNPYQDELIDVDEEYDYAIWNNTTDEVTESIDWDSLFFDKG
jgi:hypothetical protein